MSVRFSILMLLLIIRVLFAPAWFAMHIHEVRNPDATWEHVRLHKRRSGFTDDVTHEDATFVVNESITLRVFLRLIVILIKGSLPATMVWLLPDQSSSFSYLLFLRHRVLRI